MSDILLLYKYRHKLDNRQYDFIVEFERTRTPKAIMEEKIRLNEKIRNFRKFGFSKQTKFLYVFTTENFDVTTRPVEYFENRSIIQRVEKQFGQLVKMAGKLPKYKYRFAVLHQFMEFGKVVWVMPRGQKTKIDTYKPAVSIPIQDAKPPIQGCLPHTRGNGHTWAL